MGYIKKSRKHLQKIPLKKEKDILEKAQEISSGWLDRAFNKTTPSHREKTHKTSDNEEFIENAYA